MNEVLKIQLESKNIAECNSLPSELGFMSRALQHQVDVFEQSRHNDIILDLSPTGTGKTQAGLSVLLHQPNKSAIYIAPTNALITQQTEAAKQFVKNANLPHFVISASAKDVHNWPDDKVGRRSGEKLYNLLRNPATIFPEIGSKRPILLVTNPDIFYYATFFSYNPLDRANIASQFYQKFGTIIFDEFHLYDAKQLVSLLFYLAFSHALGFFKHNRKVVLLTATPEKACEAALDTLEKQGVKIAKVEGSGDRSKLIPSQTAVNLEIKPQLDKDEWLVELADTVERNLQTYPDQNGAVILDSKDFINRLADRLKSKGLQAKFGRITGSTPLEERKIASQRQVILATSTVDVGFNFERHPAPPRQNLDWLIFSVRDRASFWQRIGRVGRVLGKEITDIPSNAIAYLPQQAWEEGIANLDTSGGRVALSQSLEDLPCLERPFLEVYWRSEAFLEIARPLSELEDSLENLPQQTVVTELYAVLQSLLGGKRPWHYYRDRIKALKGAEEISRSSIEKIQNKKYIKGGQAFVKTYIKACYPEDWEKLHAKQTQLDQYQNVFKKRPEVVEDIKKFAEIWKVSHAPIFQFRDSLFENLRIKDPRGFLLDDAEQTFLDPFHLLRYYEFIQDGDLIELTHRADEIYELSFYWRYYDDAEDFKNTELGKLTAFSDCRIERRLGGAICPTPLLAELEKSLLPGVIIATIPNQAIIFKLRKQRIASYPITVSCDDFEKEYTFLPGLSGILTVAMYGVRIKLPDNEDFYIAG